MGAFEPWRSWQRWLRRWGVHPEEHKYPAANEPVRTVPVPARMYVPLQQHLGAAAQPVVRGGEVVRKGQLLAQAQSGVSAAIHAPTSGRVIAIGTVSAPHPSGLAIEAIVLEADGLDRWIEPDVPPDPFALSPVEVAARIAAAGIVGMGGATFPSALKLDLARRSQIHTLILNGGECEPYLSCDDRLMREHAAEVVDGARLMLHASGASRALIAIERNKPQALAAMRRAAAASSDVAVVELPTRYPMGSEKHLVWYLLGEEVPADGRAVDLGVVVHNVATAQAVHRALRFGQPLVERLVTVNGAAVRLPGNYRVAIGTLVQDVLAHVGLVRQPARLVLGGPMMGQAIPHTRVPVVKGSNGILALTGEEVMARQPATCIRCGACVRACPVGLLPLEMAAEIAADKLDKAVALGLKDCLACGCCAYVCPSRLPLVHAFQHAKGALASAERERLKAEAVKKLAAARQERLAREARERAEAAARRKAQRQAASAANAGDGASRESASASAASAGGTNDDPPIAAATPAATTEVSQ